MRSDIPLRRTWTILATLPLVIPSYVSALTLIGALGPRGLLQEALEPIGVDRLPEIYGYAGALLALTLSTYPFVFLLVAAALRSVDPSTEEAAQGLGVAPHRVFLTVTLPAIRPAVAASALLVVLYVLSDFGAVSLMQHRTLTTAVYLQYESLLDRSSAATLALVLIALAGCVIWLESRARGARTTHRTSPGAGRRLRPTALGRWRLPAIAFCGATVGLFLIVPTGVLIWWTIEGAGTAGTPAIPWATAFDTVTVSVVAAMITALVIVPVALLSWRYPSRLSRLLERLTFVPNAIPGIAIGLALIFFGIRAGSFLYQSLGLLVFAYTIRYMPQTLAATRSGLASISPNLLEASQALGHGRIRTFARVVLPLARPGVLAGAAIAFLSTMKELPATLLLRPTGFDTLATHIWTNTSLGYYTAAAPAALLLMVAALPFSIALSTRRAWELGASG